MSEYYHHLLDFVNHKLNRLIRAVHIFVMLSFTERKLDTPKRSIVKAVLWNLLGLVTMALVGYLLTGSISTGGTMAVINTALGFSLYLVYERIWSRVRWGRHV